MSPGKSAKRHHGSPQKQEASESKAPSRKSAECQLQSVKELPRYHKSPVVSPKRQRISPVEDRGSPMKQLSDLELLSAVATAQAPVDPRKRPEHVPLTLPHRGDHVKEQCTKQATVGNDAGSYVTKEILPKENQREADKAKRHREQTQWKENGPFDEAMHLVDELFGYSGLAQKPTTGTAQEQPSVMPNSNRLINAVEHMGKGMHHIAHAIDRLATAKVESNKLRKRPEPLQYHHENVRNPGNYCTAMNNNIRPSATFVPRPSYQDGDRMKKW